MSYDTEHYYAVQTFLEDDELSKIWNIIEIAMEREGYDVQNAELSMRLYDSETQSKILDDLTDKFFDVKGIKELYDILMEEVYGDGGIKGY